MSAYALYKKFLRCKKSVREQQYTIIHKDYGATNSIQFGYWEFVKMGLFLRDFTEQHNYYKICPWYAPRKNIMLCIHFLVSHTRDNMIIGSIFSSILQYSHTSDSVLIRLYKYFASCGMKPGNTSDFGYDNSPLYMAIKKKKYRLVKEILQHPEIIISYNSIAYACASSSLSIVKLLLPHYDNSEPIINLIPSTCRLSILKYLYKSFKLNGIYDNNPMILHRTIKTDEEWVELLKSLNFILKAKFFLTISWVRNLLLTLKFDYYHHNYDILTELDSMHLEIRYHILARLLSVQQYDDAKRYNAQFHII